MIMVFFDCAWVLGYADSYNNPSASFNGAWFAVNLHPSGQCLKTECKQVGGIRITNGMSRSTGTRLSGTYNHAFTCITGGAWYLKYIDNRKTTVKKVTNYTTLSKEFPSIQVENGWDYYVVTLNPAQYTYSGYAQENDGLGVQSVKGVIAVRKPPVNISVNAKEDDRYLDNVPGQHHSYPVIKKEIIKKR